MTEEHDNTVGDQITSQASGPVSQQFGEQTNITTGGGDAAGRDIDKRQGEIFVDGNVYGDVIREQHNYYQPATTLLDRQQQRNRRTMLTKVKTIWIEGLLEHSLAKELRIVLDLTEQPNAVDLPLNAIVQELKHPPRPLPAGIPIITVFEQMGGALLILGAPGAGKTTLLLELARDLIARAEQDEGHPIPIVFNLSSWAEKQRPLKDWLVEELNRLYDVPRKLAKAWMDADVVLPLLDGLDEVATGYRAACVGAINAYRQEQSMSPLAVCSRVADYEALATKLRLQCAVMVQPLTPPQVDAYLERAGEKLAGVRTALRDDAELREMLDTPLMLSIVTLAYGDKSAADVQTEGTPDERRQHLFDAYIAAMFQRRSKEAHYPQQQTLRWLCWLAHGLTRQSQTLFLVERLQPEWLPTRAMRLQYMLLDRCSGLLGGLIYGLGTVPVFEPGTGLLGGLIFGVSIPLFGGQTNIETLRQRSVGHTVVDVVIGILVGVLIGGLVGGLVGGLISGLSGGLVGGLVSGLGGGTLGGLLGVLTGKPGLSPRQVIVVERLQWEWHKAQRSVVSGLLCGLGGGLIFGLLTEQVFELVSTLGSGLVSRLLIEVIGRMVGGAVNGLLFGLVFGLLAGLVSGLSSGPLTTVIRVNQGIERSARSALVGGLAGGLIFGLLTWLFGGIGVGLLGGLGVGLLGGFSFGGYTCLSHLVLRLVLYHNGLLPLRLVPFLDYCAERIFLRKVGGGYIFVHRLLMEHFASLYETPPTEKSG